MLEPIVQNVGTTDRERYLAKLASSQFFSLWSYPGLSRPAKKGITKELADLTIIFGDHIVLFSDKDIAWPLHPNTETAWSRWYRAAVLDSAGQLWGAVKHLRGPDPVIFLDARCETPFPLPVISSRTRIHLIAVASNSVEPARDYFSEIGGPGSSGTLVHAFGAKEVDEGKRPFVIGDLDKKKPYVHVFDEESLDRVLSELGTIVDFVHYLSEKETAIRSGKLSLYAGEEDLLAFYLQEQTPDGYGSLPFVHHRITKGHTVNIPEGEWRAYARSEAYRIRSRMRERAREWFKLIEPFSKAVLAAQTGEANETPLEVHEVVLRAAASENLASRARLGTAFAEKYKSVPIGVRTSRAAPSLCHPGRVYLFVFIPWTRHDATYEEYRAYRLQVMQAYAYVAPLKFSDMTEIIVVGAQTPDETGTRSETMIYCKYDEPLSPEQIAEATELMQSERILTDLPGQSLCVEAPLASLSRRYGRNEPCPCGSLKKNKMCCNISGPRYGTIYAGRVG
jgi:hypothetical protein